jgi:hypothetical protein
MVVKMLSPELTFGLFGGWTFGQFRGSGEGDAPAVDGRRAKLLPRGPE